MMEKRVGRFDHDHITSIEQLVASNVTQNPAAAINGQNATLKRLLKLLNAQIDGNMLGQESFKHCGAQSRILTHTDKTNVAHTFGNSNHKDTVASLYRLDMLRVP